VVTATDFQLTVRRALLAVIINLQFSNRIFVTVINYRYGFCVFRYKNFIFESRVFTIDAKYREKQYETLTLNHSRYSVGDYNATCSSDADRNNLLRVTKYYGGFFFGFRYRPSYTSQSGLIAIYRSTFSEPSYIIDELITNNK